MELYSYVEVLITLFDWNRLMYSLFLNPFFWYMTVHLDIVHHSRLSHILRLNPDLFLNPFFWCTPWHCTPFEVERNSRLSPILSSVHLGLSPSWGWVYSGLSPFWVRSIRGSVHSGFSPFEVHSTRGGVFLGSVGETIFITVHGIGIRRLIRQEQNNEPRGFRFGIFLEM